MTPIVSPSVDETILIEIHERQKGQKSVMLSNMTEVGDNNLNGVNQIMIDSHAQVDVICTDIRKAFVQLELDHPLLLATLNVISSSLP